MAKRTFVIPEVCIYGDEIIDKEHQEIVDLVLGLEDFSNQEQECSLQAYCDKTREAIENHFVTEETLMTKTGFPGASGHMQNHRELMVLGNNILTGSVARGAVVDQDIKLLISDVVRHMLMDDIAFRDHLREMGILKMDPLGH
jgi:hemerythrin-like metal-binding protein